jgi:lambda family phage tail tape measure protein
MANTIARLGVRLGIDSAEFTKGIEAAKKELSTFATAASGYATVASAAFAAMTVKALQYADSIADVAKANDVAISTVLQLSSALQQNGGSAESASKIFAAFTTFVDKAADGSFEAQKAFKDVNVSLKDLGTLSAEDLFAKVLKGLGEIPDQLTRQARAYEILGKGIKGVDIAGLADDMSKVSAITEKQIKAVEDAAKAWDLLEKASKEAMLTFTTFVGTPMLKMVEYLTELPKLVDKARIAYENMGNTISFVNRLQAAVIMRDTDSLKKLVEDYYKIKNTIDLGKFDGGGDSYDNPASVTSAKDTSEKRKTKLGVDPELAKAEALRQQQIRFNITQRQREGKEIEDNTKRMVEQFATEVLRQDALEKTLKNKQAEFELDIAGKQMREEDVRLAKDLLQIESSRADKIRDIKLNNDLNLAAQEQLIDRENQLANEAERLARARNEISRSIREGTLEQGFGLAMEDYFRNAATAMERGQQIFTSVIGNMGAAIDNFVRTGKFAFKDFARSIIQDIISIQLRAQATQLFGMALAGFGGKYTPGSNSFVGPMPQGFADGGSPPVGVASLVGERGPELFIPKTAGTIIPNGTLSSVMGGGQTVNYNGPYIANMSAIDTQSSIQFLSKNKQAVWAANQSAQRSLPMSR